MNIATMGNPDNNLLIHGYKKLIQCCKEDRAKTGTLHLLSVKKSYSVISDTWSSDKK